MLPTSGQRQNTRALVTGCAGFIGSHLTERLLADGVSVIGIDCFNDNYQRPPKLRNLNAQAKDWDAFEFVPIDLSLGDLDDLVRDVDVIYHLAAEPGVRASWGGRFERYVRNNIVATQHLLEALVPFPAKRFVYASSSSVYGDAETFPTPETVTPRPRSPYGMTKLSGEHLCAVYTANHGLDTVSLRYFTVFGPRQRPDMAFHRFCRAALEDQPITVYGDGFQTRDFTFVGDIVAGTLAAGRADVAPGSIYNLGGGSQVSVRDTLEIISELAGRTLKISYGEPEYGDVRDTSAPSPGGNWAFCPALRSGKAGRGVRVAGPEPGGHTYPPALKVPAARLVAQSDTPPPPPPPPGWYPDATHGGQRYWTGAGWGVHESEMPPMPTHQRPPTQSVHPGAASAPATAGPKPSDNTVSAGYALAILISRPPSTSSTRPPTYSSTSASNAAAIIRRAPSRASSSSPTRASSPSPTGSLRTSSMACLPAGHHRHRS